MLLFPIIDYSMPKENNDDRDEEAQAAISDTGKDIKKGWTGTKPEQNQP
jgi:hypothetical protein